MPEFIHAAPAGRISWLILAYRVPTEPSRLRSTLWRRLKAADAVYLASSVAAMPKSPAAERFLRRLRNEILDAGGSALVLHGEAIAGEEEMVSAFNTVQDEQYDQIIARCHDLLSQVGSSVAAGQFTYAELAQADKTLTKLADSLRKAGSADAFDAAQAGSAARALSECQMALDAFAADVYRLQEQLER
jgi:hypothetical protein